LCAKRIARFYQGLYLFLLCLGEQDPCPSQSSQAGYRIAESEAKLLRSLCQIPACCRCPSRSSLNRPVKFPATYLSKGNERSLRLFDGFIIEDGELTQRVCLLLQLIQRLTAGLAHILEGCFQLGSRLLSLQCHGGGSSTDAQQGQGDKLRQVGSGPGQSSAKPRQLLLSLDVDQNFQVQASH
jgi:hypothetical protein